jgi:hypothetical protein
MMGPTLLALGLVYTVPVGQLSSGHSLGNRNTYVSLDATTDVLPPDSAAGAPNGIHESTDQRSYATAWRVTVRTTQGETATPVATSFYPAHQETSYRLNTATFTKRFFVPVETGYPRAAHFLLERGGQGSTLHVESHLALAAGADVQQAGLKGAKYALIRYPGQGTAVLFASSGIAHFRNENNELVTDYDWPPGQGLALSFLYTPGSSQGLAGSPAEMLLDAVAQSPAGPPSAEAYLTRVRQLLRKSERALERYLDTATLLTPDPLIDRASAWAKVNMVRVQQQYRSGDAVSNAPPLDVIVARDSGMYVMGASFIAQPFSRRLLDLWLAHGVEPAGKLAEYLMASQEPIYTDDYGLNINDDTPLFIIAAHQYYSLSGDKGFLAQAYPALLRVADWIESQRKVGENNHFGLVWCDSIEQGVRGLCTWRNVIEHYTLTGAVTEVNSEAYAALRAIAELAGAMGDTANETRFNAAAAGLKGAINRYLFPDGAYLLAIDMAGKPMRRDTVDQLLPVLYDVADESNARAILTHLFSDRFFVTAPDGAGGFRTVSTKDVDYAPKRSDALGCLGGVWFYPGTWMARAAAAHHEPDLALKALRANALITEMPQPKAADLVPGEFPDGYFEGDAPWTIRSKNPIGPDHAGLFLWASLESFMGLEPHAAGITVNPELPSSWGWVAITHMPYRGGSLSLLAVRATHTLYSTAPVNTTWKSVIVQDSELKELIPHG